MATKTFIDKDGVFFLTLLAGSKKGYDVFRMMETLYQADSSNPLDLSKATTKVESIILNSSDKENELFPCIIIVKRDLLRQWLEAERKNFVELPDENEKNRVKKLVIELQIYADQFDKNLKNTFGFFNNSSIWVRIVEWDRNKIKDAQEELDYFDKIRLYNYGSAKENLEYNIRLQKQNYLDSTAQGHGVYVTPQLYGDETGHWKILFEDNKK